MLPKQVSAPRVEIETSRMGEELLSMVDQTAWADVRLQVRIEIEISRIWFSWVLLNRTTARFWCISHQFSRFLIDEVGGQALNAHSLILSSGNAIFRDLFVQIVNYPQLFDDTIAQPIIVDNNFIAKEAAKREKKERREKREKKEKKASVVAVEESAQQAAETVEEPEEDEEIPNAFICPISQEIMIDPVIAGTQSNQFDILISLNSVRF